MMVITIAFLSDFLPGRQREKASKEGKKKCVVFNVGDNGFGAGDGDDGDDALVAVQGRMKQRGT